jgi:hypothetical protein
MIFLHITKPGSVFATGNPINESDNMQFILTREEYAALLKKQEISLGLQKDKLQALCTKIADTMPVKVRWRKGPDQPWGCIITEKKKGHGHYCDECPVRDICPKEYKEYSQ